MFDYLQKFNSLPKDLRDKVSAPETMRSILELERIYKVDLAALVMKIMVKLISLDDLVVILTSESGLSTEQAKSLKDELLLKVFNQVSAHLGLTPSPAPAPVITPAPVSSVKNPEIAAAIKSAGIILPSSDLYERLEKMLETYQKGIRNKIDTRSSLSKKVQFGGLDLSEVEIERIFRTLSGKPITLLPKIPFTPVLSAPAESRAKLDRIIMEAEATSSLAAPSQANPILSGYDLKRSIEEMKKEKKAPLKEIEAPDKINLLSEPEEELLLEAPKPPIETPKPPIEAPKPPIKVQEKAEEKKSEVVEASLPVEAVIEKVAIKTETVKDKIIEPKNEENKDEPIKPLPVNMNFKRPEPIGNESRPRMQDIKPVPKIMSPIEELAFLDVVNFRRLGADAVEITDKIFAKIKLLEKDGYDKMVQGVASWRKSEVNRLYLKIGQEAVFSGTSVRDAVLSRQKQNKIFLNIEEIEAISKLNSRLSF